MSYTKNYYAILGLETQDTPNTHPHIYPYTPSQIRASYKKALFRAHPDKARISDSDSGLEANVDENEAGNVTRKVDSGKGEGQWTVDDVKEAYVILSDETQRAEYDAWLQREGWKEFFNDNSRGRENPSGSSTWTQDFILGLEILDLEDFTQGDGNGEDEPMIWTRPCRCGAETGYTIEESELEDAVRRGEGEVLVGCGGCSLWVRVGFEVEVG